MLILPHSKLSSQRRCCNIVKAAKKVGSARRVPTRPAISKLQTEMSFRERMKVAESHADEDLRIEVQKRGLLRETSHAIIMPTNTVIVFKEEGYDLVDKYSFTLAMAEKHQFTIPDLIVLQFLDAPAINAHSRMITDVIPFYLDGPPHKQKGVEKRDNRINQHLKDCGIPFRRFPYEPPISKRLLKQICDEIEELMT